MNHSTTKIKINNQKKPKYSEIKRWRYILAGILMFLCLGTVYSWSVFRKPLEELFQIGSTESGLPYMLFLACYSFLMPAGGLLLEKNSPRKVILLGTLLVGGGWILAGYSQNIIHLSLTYGVMAGSGVGIIYGVPMAVVARWFPDKTGFAVGLTLLGFGLSPLITAPAARALIDAYTPLPSFRILGILFLILLIVLSLPFRFPTEGEALPKADQRNRQSDYPETDTHHMIRTRKFAGHWLSFAIITMVGLMSIRITRTDGEELKQMDPHKLSWMISLIALGNGAGRPFFGWLTDRLGTYLTALITYSMMILSSLLMLLSGETSTLIYVLSFGLLWMTLGGWLAIAPASTSLFFGRKFYSKNYGFVFTAYGVGAILGVLLSGFIRDSFGSYLYVFYPVLLLGILGMLLATSLLKEKKVVW